MEKPKGLIHHAYYDSKEEFNTYHKSNDFVRLGIAYWDERTGSLCIVEEEKGDSNIDLKRGQL